MVPARPSATLPDAAGRVRARHETVLLVLAPPRTASTAVARALWQHPAIGYYGHEPFDTDYHLGGAGGWAALEQPLARRAQAAGVPTGLVVKEMTFQVAESARELLGIVTHPVVFVVRDPRLSVESRMRQRRRSGLDPSFPPRETGWPDLMATMERCDRDQIPYVIADATDVRRDPGPMLSALCTAVGLEPVADLHRWEPEPDLRLGQLGEAQRHWYERVLSSSGIEPPTERVPGIDVFPAETGLRAAVSEALEQYWRLCASDRCLRPRGPRAGTEASRR